MVPNREVVDELNPGQGQLSASTVIIIRRHLSGACTLAPFDEAAIHRLGDEQWLYEGGGY